MSATMKDHIPNIGPDRITWAIVVACVLIILASILGGCAALNQPNTFTLHYSEVDSAPTIDIRGETFWGGNTAATARIEVEVTGPDTWSLKVNSAETASPEGQVTMTERFFGALENIVSGVIGYFLGG